MKRSNDVNQDSSHCSMENDIRFGIGRYRPKCLQGFARITWFVAFLSMFSVMQGMLVNGLMSACIPHLEREFGFSSTKSGMILASNDISGLLFVLIISYFGENGDKPKWLGCGSIVTGLGMLFFSLPKFIKGPYIPSTSAVHSKEMCNLTASNTSNYGNTCTDNSSASLYLVLFCVSNILAGAGTAPLYTLGATYIDENVPPKKSPLYIGIWFAATLFGPTAGYFIGGNFLTQWVDVNQPASVSINTTQWVGRWWLPYLTLSWILILVGFFLAMFPKKMPNANEEASKKQNELTEKSTEQLKKIGIVGFWKCTVALLRNKVFTVTTLAATSQMFMATGTGPFFPKLLIEKFGADPSKAVIMAGVLLLITSISGLLIGSVMMNRVKIKKSVRFAVLICIVFSALSAALGLHLQIPGCNTIKLMGFNYNKSNGSTNCSANCQCEKVYSPICSGDVTYYSPCFAGCQHKTTDGTYTNCTCISSHFSNNTKRFAYRGICDQKCKNFILFLAITGIAVVFSFISGTPKNMIILRCVPENQRSFAMGLNYLILRALGMFPSPIVVGWLLDTTCLVWKYNDCGDKQNCITYKIAILSNNMTAILVAGNGVATILYMVAWFLLKREKKKEMKRRITFTENNNITGVYDNKAADCFVGEETRL